jgi:hypothetical protein
LDSGCLVLITSRKDLQLSGEFEALEIKLGALGPTNAIKLLTSVSKSAIDPDDAAEIVKLCGYLPLPIRIVGSTLARSPNVTPKEMIKHLSDESKRLELLAASPFHAAFDLYPEDVKKHLMAISVFPGSFDIEAAQAVFGLSAVDTQAKLTMLIELNEIEYNVVSGRYMQNDLLRLYCQKKAEAVRFLRQFLACFFCSYTNHVGFRPTCFMASKLCSSLFTHAQQGYDAVRGFNLTKTRIRAIRG